MFINQPYLESQSVLSITKCTFLSICKLLYIQRLYFDLPKILVVL